MTQDTITKAYTFNCRVYNILQVMAQELDYKRKHKLALALYRQFCSHRKYMRLA